MKRREEKRREEKREEKRREERSEEERREEKRRGEERRGEERSRDIGSMIIIIIIQPYVPIMTLKNCGTHYHCYNNVFFTIFRAYPVSILPRLLQTDLNMLLQKAFLQSLISPLVKW